ncbi:hypothetical protein BRE01_30080 [Brevibacillus reuszeri]|uniref:Fe/B12 periplasmic-binding domain-containing protein n=1 Tax=Brevibacillus reuszeri TaxID=54915 RepID=A0ABQ0TN69_9BACL|nr:ABC transporter substrate-binding protein [Brevibacillus reuszeri]MED1859087.1 ABC transporter substrate-binding protein [Brevibacillus reuszeri]GED69306.1 hypothetical protein BRE01_30080 [Brevibacillus reuszeri]
MNNIRSIVGAVGTIVLATSLLFGCSSQTSQKQENAPSSAEAATRSYTDYKGHTSPIPVSPQRIIFWGETFGDTLALGVKPVGGSGYTNQVFEDRLQDVEDVGFPINLEKVLELKPDVILYAGTDEKDFDALSKIAPTVIFDTFAPLEERMTLLGDLIGKKEEAKKCLKEYKQSAESMWKKLKETGMKEGETASVDERIFLCPLSSKWFRSRRQDSGDPRSRRGLCGNFGGCLAGLRRRSHLHAALREAGFSQGDTTSAS